MKIRRPSICRNIIPVIAIFVFGMLPSPGYALSTGNWAKQATITFTGYNRASTLTNFPVLVEISASQPGGFAYSDCLAAAADLRFTDGATNAWLDYEIDTWNTSGVSYAWVRVPALASSSDKIIMFWDNSGASAQGNATNTWDADFRGIYHLNEDVVADGSGATHYDATVNARNGTQNGNDTYANGVVGKAQDCESLGGNVNENVRLTTGLITGGSYTKALWLRVPTYDGQSAGSFFSGVTAGGGGMQVACWSTPKQLAAFTQPDSATSGIVNAAVNFPTQEWMYVAATWYTNGSTSDHMLYTNGVLVATANNVVGCPPDTANPSLTTLRLASHGDGMWGLAAQIDEVRVSGVARSTDWLWAEYMTSGKNASLQTYGTTGDNVDTLSWGRKATVTFSGYNKASTLTNFPVLVKLSASQPSGFSYSECLSGGADLRFTDAAKTTWLNYEIDTWNASGDSYVWVQVPTISGTDTEILMFWSNTTATAQGNADATWDTDFRGIYHLDESSNPSVDSSINGKDSTAWSVNMASHSTGLVGAAMDTGAYAGGGHGEYIAFPTGLITGGAYTKSVWFNFFGGDYSNSFADVNSPQSAGACFDGNQYGGGGMQIGFWSDQGQPDSLTVFQQPDYLPAEASDPEDWPDDVWTHVAATWYTNGATSEVRLYKNGVQVGSTAANAPGCGADSAPSASPIYLFSVGGGGWGAFGQGDEMRCSSVARSGDWIWAEYMTAASNTTLQTYGAAGDNAGLLNQTITFDPLGTNTYGTADYALTATASSSLTVTYESSDTNVASISSSVLHIVGIGTTTITASQAGDATYDVAVDVQQQLTISKKDLTVSGITASDKIYNGNNSASINIGSAALVGVVGGDSVTLDTGEVAAFFGDAQVAAGKIVQVNGLVITGVSASNYSLIQPADTASITAKQLTVTNFLAANKVYDATTTASVSSWGALDGIVGIDNVTLTTSGGSATFASANAADGITVTASGLTLGGTSAGNYSLAQPTATANITAKGLTITGFTASSKVYDATTTASASAWGSLVGIIGGDSVTLTTSGGSATFASVNVANGITVTASGLTLGGTSAGNYSLTAQPTTTANITAKGLTVTGFTASSKVYDATTTASASAWGSLVGVIGGDGVTLTTSGGSATFASANVANGITVTASGLTLGGTSAGNYSLTAQPTTTANITTMGLTVTGFTASNKVYDATATASASSWGSLSGVIGGDTVSLTTSGGSAAFASSAVADGITVTASGLTLGGTSADNYSLSQPSTTANITEKGLTVTGFTASNKVYDATTTASASSWGSLSGVIGGDTVSLTTSGGSAAFVSSAVANGITVTASGLTLGGTSAGNYSLTAQPTTTANITVKGLTVSGFTANNKVYDGNTAASASSWGSLSGVIGGDSVTLTTSGGSAAFAWSDLADGITVTASGLTLGGTSAGNYSLTAQPTTTANITAKGLTVTGITADDKSYDGNTTATIHTNGVTLVGVVGGDNVVLELEAAIGTFDTATPGVNKTVQISGLTLGGADAANYSLTHPTTTADIVGTPSLVIATEDATVGNVVTTYDVSGSNNASVVGSLVWTNSLGGSGAEPAVSPWTIVSIPLSVGTNLVTVTGTNALGTTFSDSVTLVRQADVNADSDGDGMPDWWEIRFSGSATGVVTGVDGDIDGVNNGDEYVMGTDPTDPTSYLRLLNIQYSGGMYVVEWLGGTNGPLSPYGVASRTSLMSGSWQSLGSQSRQHGTNSWSNAMGGDMVRFIRITATN